MNKFRFMAAVGMLILLAGNVHLASAQIGITLSNGSISNPVNGLESTIYSEMVIESFYDKNTAAYLLNGQVVKTYSSGDFSGTYDPSTQQISGQYFLSLTTPISDLESEVYTLTGTFSGLIGNSGSVTLTLAGTILYEKWNGETDKDGFPLYENNLEESESSSDSRQATFTITGDTSQSGISGSAAEDESNPPTEPAGQACSPQPYGIDPSKPGDVISPGAAYVDDNGKEVGIIQERWFLNGVNTNSIVWDGQQVQVELQYTCLDHKGHSVNFTISPYQAQPVNLPGDEQTSASEQSAPTEGGGPLGIAAIIAIVVGAFGAVGAGVGYALKNKPGKPARPAPQVDVPLPTPPTVTPAAPPTRVTLPSTPMHSEPPLSEPDSFNNSQPPSHKLTPEEKDRLTNIREEMQAEVEQIKIRWSQTREASKKLKTFKKKNMMKFIIKKGLDVNEWIMNSPVEVINKVVVDPVMETAFEKHDTSQDSNIIVQIHNRIISMETEMQQMMEEVKYLQTEISKINQILTKSGG